MDRLCLHVASLGKFGPTGFLVPVYGSGELPQALCRSAAVFGATYLLRRPPRGIVLDGSTNAVAGVVLDCPADAGVEAAEAGDNAARSAAGRRSDRKTKRVSCDHVVVPLRSLPERWRGGGTAERFVLRRISVLRGKCVRGDDPRRDGPRAHQEQQQQQLLVIFPPGSVDPLHPHPVHALLLDEHASVAPRVPFGCTVVHLTTVSPETAKADGLLEGALRCLLRASASKSGSESRSAAAALAEGDDDDNPACQEIFHATFSYRLDDDGGRADGSGAPGGRRTPSLPRGLHAVPRAGADAGNEEAFELARRIFRRICPGAEYMRVAPEVAEKALARGGGGGEGGEDDDDRRILEASMEAIGQGKKDGTPPPQADPQETTTR
jgi:hypothetical protein